MGPITVTAERLIPAPADAVHALLADYRQGHPSILPAAFSNLTVLEGGVGASTVIMFKVTLAGRTQEATARVDEPEPGRILTETDVSTGLQTTFETTPQDDGCLLRIVTTWEPQRGLAGWVERLLAPRLLASIYAEELDNIVRWADRRNPDAN